MEKRFETGASRAGVNNRLDKLAQAQEAWFGKTGANKPEEFDPKKPTAPLKLPEY